jgi:hypothetical protein
VLERLDLLRPPILEDLEVLGSEVANGLAVDRGVHVDPHEVGLDAERRLRGRLGLLVLRALRRRLGARPGQQEERGDEDGRKRDAAKARGTR